MPFVHTEEFLTFRLYDITDKTIGKQPG